VQTVLHTSNIASEERNRIQQVLNGRTMNSIILDTYFERRKTQLTALLGYLPPTTSFAFCCISWSSPGWWDEMRWDERLSHTSWLSLLLRM
jgi:hypothetical protein